MNKKTTILLITAACLIVIGGILFTGGMQMLNWKFTDLSTTHFETNVYELTDEYKDICISAKTTTITIVPAQDDKTTVHCFEDVNEKHTVSIENGCLNIQAVNNKKWYNYIGIHFETPKLTISLPKSAYEDLTITTSTGHIDISKDFQFQDITIAATTGYVKNQASASGNISISTSTGAIKMQDLSAKELKLSVSTGKITLSNIQCTEALEFSVSTGKSEFFDVTCKNMKSTGDTGDIILTNVIVSEKMSLKRSTGDIRFDRSDAGEILIKTDTGHITGSLLSEKVFMIHTDTGRIDVPRSTTGGACEITTDTGNIVLTFEKS